MEKPPISSLRHACKTTMLPHPRAETEACLQWSHPSNHVPQSYAMENSELALSTKTLGGPLMLSLIISNSEPSNSSRKRRCLRSFKGLEATCLTPIPSLDMSCLSSLRETFWPCTETSVDPKSGEASAQSALNGSQSRIWCSTRKAGVLTGKDIMQRS